MIPWVGCATITVMGRKQERGQPREVRRRGARAWVWAVLFAVFGLGVGAWSASAAYTQFALRDDGVTTQARVVVTQSAGKYMKCEVSYQDAAGVRREAWIDAQCGGAKAGQSVVVRYLRSDPTTVAAASSLSLSQILTNDSGYLFVGLVALVVGLVGVLTVTGVLGRWVDGGSTRTAARAPGRGRAG